ncbi:GspH/FimT family protein [uncultured Thiodictyon sp.]|uniref:GspH/FimT family pseudopilin n=1 Tax=uncultured Thiodictyon sp. TaxID=1846217 RepID=UPI002600F932|nr:GspH/FimT family protein [uncultured Thiodictyon sp.]
MKIRQLTRIGCGVRKFALRGFTLIELMVTVAVMVVLVIVATPALNDATLGNRLTSYASRLMAGAYLARGEAIKRNALITLCASSNGTGCATSGGWEQGWIVTCASNNSVTCTSGGTGSPIVFQRQGALPIGFKVISTDPLSLLFQPTGVGTTQATLKFCRTSPLGKQERQVTIGATGGVSAKRTSTGSCS